MTIFWFGKDFVMMPEGCMTVVIAGMAEVIRAARNCSSA